MTARNEIKEAFVAELLISSEYQECLSLKQTLLDEIVAPNVNSQITYSFTEKLSDKSKGTFALCFQLLFGWEPEFLTNTSITINMSRFLD